MPRQKKYKENVAEGERVSPNAVYDYLIQKGVPHKHALGMLANIKHESNFIPTSKGDGGTSAGLFQHHNERYKALKKHVNNDLRDWKGQIDYTLTEPSTKTYLKQKFNNGEEASHYFTMNNEIPANAKVEAVKRQTYIKTFLDNRGQDYKQRLHNPDGIDPSEDLASAYDEDVNKTAYADMIPEEEKKKIAFKKDYDVEKTIEEKTDDSEARQELTAQEKEHLAKTNFINDLTELLNPSPDNQDTDNTDTPTYQPQDHTYLADQRDAFQPIQAAQQLFSIPQAMNGGYFDDQSIVLRDGGPIQTSVVENTSGPREFIPSSNDYENYEPTDEEKAWMMSHIIKNASQGNKAAMRMMNEHTKDYTFTGDEYDEQLQRPAGVPAGEKGTHFSASMGRSFVPFIQEGENGELFYNGKANPRDAEAIHFNTPEEAEFFANHYKKANPPMMREWYQNHYQEGTPQQRFGGLAPMPKVGGHNDDSMI